ncbi:MAG: lysylphosphatidylglycerol synthase transmembrane domain-containing protein [Solirubrobacteraceae bacterium]
MRLVVAVAVVTWCVARVQGVGGMERAVFEAFNSLPNGLHAVFRVLYRVGFLVAVGLVGASAMIGRRWRLARDLALAGGSSAAVAILLNHVVGEPAGAAALFHLIRRWPAGPSFPSIRVALVVGVFAAASPYLARPTRRLLVVVAAGVAIATLYLGAGYPVDVLVGAVVGWGAAAAVHLTFRSPGGRPTAAQVAQSLLELGVRAHDVHLDPVQQTGFTRMVGADHDGPLSIKVIGRDESDARLIAKLWRFLVYKDSGRRLSWTRLADVEHEAYATLLAGSGGVRTPKPLVAGRAGPGAALLVERPISGVTLGEVAPALITDALLDALWTQVARLQAAHVVHGRLNCGHVVVGESGPAIVRFDHASVSGSALAARDVAELLASTAHLVGPERAVAAAGGGIGPDAVRAALPWLQPAALSRETRAGAGGRRELRAQLAQLREVAADGGVGEPAPLEELHRVRRSSLAMAVAALVAVIVLLTEIEAPATLWHTLSAANAPWLAVALLASMTTNLAFAVGLIGTTRLRLPFWATAELQVATSFSNLLVPVVGGTAMQIRFLQRQGANLATAIAAAGLIATAAAVAAQLPMFVIAALITPDHLSLGNVSIAEGLEILLVIVVLVGILAGIAFGVPRFRRLVLPSLHDGASTVTAVVRSPRQLGLLLAGNAVAAILYCVCLFACLRAFGGTASIWTLLSLSIGVSTIGGIIPIAGAGAAVSTIGISGALIAVGVDKDIAVATGIINQLVVTYLPALPGWLAMRDLVGRDYL